MKKFITIVIGLISLFGCQKTTKVNARELHEWFSDNNKKKILTTTAHVKDLVKAIGQEYVDVIELIHGEQDPHSYILVKGDDEKFARADLIFSNGLFLEHSSSLFAQLEKNPKTYALGNILYKKNPSSIILINRTVDPHIWMDVALWRQTVGSIVDALNTIIPEHKDQIKKNAEKLEKDLEELDMYIKKKMSTLPLEKRFLVTTHDAFHYFTRHYLANEEEKENGSWQEHCRAPEGLAPDSQLSTVDIQRLVDYLFKHKIHVVFAESNVSRDSIKKLVDACREKGHEVRIPKEALFADAMGPKGSLQGTYIGMMLYNADKIFTELSQ